MSARPLKRLGSAPADPGGDFEVDPIDYLRRARRARGGARLPRLACRRLRSSCRRRGATVRLTPLAALLLLLLPVPGWAAAFGSVTGSVRDAAGKPVAGAKVVLESPARSRLVRRTDARGRFDFPTVAIGQYRLNVTDPGFTPSSQTVTVEAGYFPVAKVVLMRTAKLARIVVTANREVPPVASVTPITLVSAADILRTPGAVQVNNLSMITDFVPGAYEVHDMLHVRGGHQFAWLIDGVEIPNTNIASNLGPQIDPEDIETLGVERGSYQADEGDRTYGIFNVIPKNGFGSTNQGVLDVTAGNYGQTDDHLSVASHTGRFAYYASVAGNRSDLGLETPAAQVIHDQTHGLGAFANLVYVPGNDNRVSLVAQTRTDNYQIPITPAESANDVQREADTFAVLSWDHTFPDEAVLTSSLLYHFNRADYDGGPNDVPLSTTDHRSSSYEGAQEELRLQVSHNHLDFGVFGFAQQDQQNFLLRFNVGSSPPLAETASLTGSLIAAWAQDTYQPAHWLSLTAGVRQTHFQGQITEHATDPRLGASVVLPRLNWVLSAFWGKYYQPPPLETLSGPLVQYATASDTGFLPLHGERDTERQFGITIPVAGWSFDSDYFVTEARNFFDHNPIGNSDIFFPLTDQGALIKGYELTVRSPPFWRYGQVHVAYSNQTADGFGGITGGLTDFVPGSGYFALDHDQRNTLNLGYNANLPDGFFTSFNLYVGSGFSNGDAPPSHLPSHAELDLSLGRNFTRNLSVSVSALNLFDEHLLTDNSLTFGGYHWNNPREVYAQLHYKFHY